MGLFRRNERDEPFDDDARWSAGPDETHGRLTDELARAEQALESGKFTGGQPFTGADRGAAERASAFAGSNGAGGVPAPAQDPISKLERLVKLRDEGALTAEEFEQQKRQVLDAG